MEGPLRWMKYVSWLKPVSLPVLNAGLKASSIPPPVQPLQTFRTCATPGSPSCKKIVNTALQSLDIT